MKHLEKVLKKMCKAVNVDYQKIDFKKHNWFLKYSWTQKQEDKFKEWFIKYLQDNKKARKEILRFPILYSRRNLEKAVNEFLFNYGWTWTIKEKTYQKK